MICKLNVAVLDGDARWVSFLQSEGVRWRAVASGTELPAPDYSLAVGSPVSRTGWESLLGYVESGGVAIVPRLPRGWGRISDSADDPDVISRGKGHVLLLEGNLGDLYRWSPKAWRPVCVDPPGARLVGVPIVFADKASLRANLRRALWEGSRLRGLPLVFLWHYRRGARSVFSFRVDVDGGNADDVRKLLREAEPYRSCMTWFLNWESYTGELRLFESVLASGFSLQSHGYHHWVYPDFHHNRGNLRKAERCFSLLSHRPSGFAAPLHGWNRGMARALEAAGYTYATSFGLDYDARPYLPVMDGELSRVVQVPFHPVDSGTFQLQGYRATDPTVQHYYRLLVAARRSRAEPILLYGHPEGRLGREPRVLHSIVECVADHDDVWKVGVDGYVDWWKGRASVELDLSYDEATDEVRAENASAAWDPLEHRLAVRGSEGEDRLLAPGPGPWKVGRSLPFERDRGCAAWGRVGEVLPGARSRPTIRERCRSLRQMLAGYHHYHFSHSPDTLAGSR